MSLQFNQPGEAGSGASAYLSAIQGAGADPEQLERLYLAAHRAHEAGAFASAMLLTAGAAPDNLLYSAWYYRLQQQASGGESAARHPVNWVLAVELSVALGLVFWLLSDPSWQLAGHIPYLLLLWAPLTGIALISFVTAGARRNIRLAILMSVAIGALTAYVLLVAPLEPAATRSSYLDLMLLHVPLLAWGALGLAVLGWRSATLDRFAFLSKSIETVGTAGVYSIAGGIFIGITYGLFEAIGIDFSGLVIRLLVAGGAGLIPVIAVASVYDPQLAPSAQEFRRGFGRILTILMQALLPLTLIVLAIYLVLIPFNFSEPFTHRSILIIYNIGLFGIMGLLLGVIPVHASDFSAGYQRLLRLGINLVAALAALVSLYALSAILYRTVESGLTMNRLVVIGWNAINIALLLVLLVQEMRARRDTWVVALQSVVRLGVVVYLLWGALLILALPWISRFLPG
jgi:hypothetical protein